MDPDILQFKNAKRRVQNSPQNLALGYIPFYVQQLNLVDALEMLMVGEFPKDFLVARDFHKLRLRAQVAMTQVIADDQIAVGQNLAAGRQLQRIPRKIILIQLPNRFPGLVDLYNFVTFPARQ